MLGKNLKLDNIVSFEKQRAMISSFDGSYEQKLGAVKEKLGESYLYDELRLARAKMLGSNKV